MYRKGKLAMRNSEKEMLGLLSTTHGTQTVLGSSGAVKERIRRVRGAAENLSAGSCGGVGGGWGNSPVALEDASCGGVGGGWGNSPLD